MLKCFVHVIVIEIHYQKCISDTKNCCEKSINVLITNMFAYN